jgi:hypothetical protein
MGYIDEELIENMNQYKKETIGDIDSGFLIKEVLYEFSRQSLFEDKMSIMLPDKITDIDEGLKKMKYPSEQRPAIIKTLKGMDVDFTFSILDIPIDNSGIVESRDSLRGILRKVNPSIRFMEDGQADLNGTAMGWFEYELHVIDGKMYNLMYCAPINGKLLHGILNCNMLDLDLWRPVFLQIIHTIKDEIIN